MPKKKGLGREVNKSIEMMDSLLDCLKDFSRIPLKRGLRTSDFFDDKMKKQVNDALERASTLSNMVEDLQDAVKGLKTNKNSRFARQIVKKFLQNPV